MSIQEKREGPVRANQNPQLEAGLPSPVSDQSQQDPHVFLILSRLPCTLGDRGDVRNLDVVENLISKERAAIQPNTT
jgi:hypothetical protein